MASEAPVVVLDACVLYPFHLRNLLVQTAFDGLLLARWSDAINEEWIRNLAAKRPEQSEALLRRARDVMNAVLPDANVSGYQRYLAGLDLPDSDDRHVVAAAIACQASTIVTWNLKDFPDRAISPHGLTVQTPDAFLCAMARDREDDVLRSVLRAHLNLRRSLPPMPEFVENLRRQKLFEFAAFLQRNLHRL